jgi:hypothetical protein
MNPNTLRIQSEFLEAEIEAGMSFVARARSEQASGNKQVAATALGNARKARQTASRELDRIREHLSAGEIARFQEKLDDLARAIAAVFPLGRGSPLLPAA